MKTLLCMLFAAGLAGKLSAQGRRIEIACEVRSNDIVYDWSGHFLPDSMQHYLVKIGNVRRTNLDVVNILTLRGWTLVGMAQAKEGYNSSTSSTYLLKRELLVSEEEYQKILDRTQKFLQ